MKAKARDEDVVTTVRLTRSQLDQLKAVAARNHRTVSQQTRFWFERLLEEDAQAQADELRNAA